MDISPNHLYFSGSIFMFKYLRPFLFLFALAFPSIMASGADTSGDLNRQFEAPPRAAQPWVYWVWVADTTPADLTRDLEEMKAKGITGCILYDVQTGRGVNWWTRNVVRHEIGRAHV